MASVVVNGDTSGAVTLTAPAVAGTVTVTLPAASGTMASLASVTANGVTYVNSSSQPTSGSALVFDGSNLGIGTSSPATKLNVAVSAANETTSALRVTNLNVSGYGIGIEFADELSSGRVVARIATITPGTAATGELYFQTRTASALTEKMRLDSSGQFYLGTAGANTPSSTRTGTAWGFGSGSNNYWINAVNSTGTANHWSFINGNGAAGSITTSGSNTTYSTSSDYRLKESITPITGALNVVSQLNPVTYKWKVDGSDGQGFIAHELAEVIPDCVIGEKDAVETQQYEISPAVPATFDEDGNVLTPAVKAVMGEREVPKYQGIDTSFLVATLTAAIQEQQALITTLTARITALESA